MLNAEAQVLLIAFLDGVSECVQRHARASVANGMKANLKAVIRASAAIAFSLSCS